MNLKTENKTSVEEYQQYTEQENNLAILTKYHWMWLLRILPEGCDDTEEAETTSGLKEKHCKEYFSNTKVLFDKASGAIDPASLVSLKLSTEEKAQIIKNKVMPTQCINVAVKKEADLVRLLRHDIVHFH